MEYIEKCVPVANVVENVKKEYTRGPERASGQHQRDGPSATSRRRPKEGDGPPTDCAGDAVCADDADDASTEDDERSAAEPNAPAARTRPRA
jgi:hypothetical protein